MRSRIAVNETLLHQVQGKQATSMMHAFSAPQESDEQPWIRQLRIGPEWTPLECGWVERASMLYLRNDEGYFTERIPTPEEVRDAMLKVVELDVGCGPPWMVPPKQTFRGCPSDCRAVRVRCLYGTAHCTLYLLPA